MTMEEKINNAIELFYSYYLSANNEHIRISSLVLAENGLGGIDFFDVVCPRLKTEGFLKDYYPFGNAVPLLQEFNSSSFVNPNDKQKADEIFNKKYGYAQFSPREFRHNPVAIAAAAKWDKENEDDMAKIAAMPRYHQFVVDGEKLKAIKNLKAGSENTQKIQSVKGSQITKLDIILPKNGTKMQIAVNGYTDKFLEADWQAYRYWKLIYKLAKNEPVETKDFKSEMENLNTNKNLKFYTQTGLEITKFLEDDKGYVKSKIPIVLRTSKWLAQQLKSG